jgi:hypothetical protein
MGLSGIKPGLNKESSLIAISRNQNRKITKSKLFYNTLDLSARKKSEPKE